MKARYQIATDFLEQHFGPVRAEIIHQDAKSRLIYTRTIHTGQILECAWVRFNPEVVLLYREVHEQIAAGELMGKAFRQAAIGFIRSELAGFQQSLSPKLQRIFNTQSSSATCKYVSIQVGERLQEYARNLELYSPAVPWPADHHGTHEQIQAAQGLISELGTFL
jgi:hypothetical protein